MPKFKAVMTFVFCYREKFYSRERIRKASSTWNQLPSSICKLRDIVTIIIDILRMQESGMKTFQVLVLPGFREDEKKIG